MNITALAVAELRHFAEQLQAFEAGRLPPDAFKKLRLQFGIYSLRRDAARHMVRVRVPLGIITPDQLEQAASWCEEFFGGRACHITTRQDLQFYGIARPQLPAFLQQVAASGLTTREASGNVVRNITCCPWAGVSADEAFDVTPAARALAGYLLRNPLTQLLPRKVKIAFEGCATDHACVAIHDIGVTALPGRPPTFRVVVGGGLGAAPRAARVLERRTDAALLLPTIEAVLRVFDRFGERQVRAKARLKFLIEEMGWDTFQQRVLAERGLVWAAQSGRTLLPWPVEMVRFPAADGTSYPSGSAACARWAATNVAAQKQQGYVSAIARIPCGDLRPDSLRQLAAIARRYTGGARLMATQNILLRFVSKAAVPALYRALEAAGVAETGAGCAVDIVRCPGADTCLSAITRSRGLAEAIDALLRNGRAALAGVPLSIKISGCPNGCSQHAIADIGLFGSAAKIGGRYAPYYQVVVGGETSAGSARFGERLLRLPAHQAPEAVLRIVQWCAGHRAPGETFAALVRRTGLEPLRRLVQPLSELPADAEALEAWCTDLGATAPFALDAQRGECLE